jgi:undecaprenyl-diphosphatase
MGTYWGTHWLNSFDVQIELFLNQFAGRHLWFDTLARVCSDTALLTSVVIVLLMWLVLFDRNRSGQLREGFELLLGSAFFSVFATLAARCLALSLPFRTRPLATPSLHFRLPAGGSMALINWSAFPSDHATMFFALATGILLVSRKVGWLAVAWVTLVICFPLLYMGFHWPTDVVAGAAIGVSFAQLARIPSIQAFVRRFAIKWHQKRPEVFFAVLGLWSYETAVLYNDVRHFLKWVAHSV